mmetsp:Transcript_15136/g.39860  ORF Transcript_15136/g.39860 Transcript_15136/m.39860 type:complete len:196 (+) Transcript_15136:760-1347(+)
MALCVCILWITAFISFPNCLLCLVALRGIKASVRVPATPKVVRCTNDGCQILRCARCDSEEHSGPCFADVPEEATEDGLRKYVEQQMASALVRTCPNCQTHFHKSEGCNKMKCVCGYQMCYMCRVEVKGYDHFCQHFRPTGGACKKCNSCDLFGTCDDEALIRRTGRDAMDRFFQRHPQLVGKVPRLKTCGPYKL